MLMLFSSVIPVRHVVIQESSVVQGNVSSQES